MALIADALLIAAALAAALYCHVLARRLRRLRDLDGGVGAAIAALSSQVEEMRAALAAARTVSGESARTLAETTARAEMAAGRLELLLAALHDRDGARPLDLAARRAAPRTTGPDATPEAERGEASPAATAGRPGVSAPELRADRETARPLAASPRGRTAEAPREAKPAPAEAASSPAEARPAARGRRRAVREVAAEPRPPERPAPVPPAPAPAPAPVRAIAGGRRQSEAAALRAALEALAREGDR